ncbi:MAG: hypothetical protein FJ318_01720 [SAR202 cluster bacterium]|nr:hypothetical protein [SAR202 cluster bacterium]
MGVGIALALLATLAWGAGDVFVRKATFGAVTPLVAVGALAVMVAVLGVAAFATVGWGGLTPDGARFYLLAGLMGIFAHLTGTLFYFHAMRRAGLSIVSPIIGIQPLVSIGLAMALGGERPNLPTVLAALLIVAGVIVIITDKRAGVAE